MVSGVTSGSTMRVIRLALPLASALLASSAAAGPWSKSGGELYVKLSEGAFIAGEYVAPSGETEDDVDYLGLTTALYAEVGLAKGVQVQLYLPHVVARNAYTASGDRYLTFGGGDARVGAQYSPPLPFPAAVRLDVKVPLYDVTEPGGLEGDLFPARGDGQVDVDGWLSAGGSAGDLFGFGELGWRHRTAAYPGGDAGLDFADSALAYGQLGYKLGGWFIVALNAQAVVPVEDDGRTKGYATAGPSVYAPVGGGLAVEGYADATLWAQAASRGYSVILGVSYAGEVW